MANRYQMSIHHYYEGRKTFTIEAENKKDAVDKGKLFVLQSPGYNWTHYDLNDVKCDKKLRK